MLTISPIRFNNSQPPTLQPTQRKSPSFGIALGTPPYGKIAVPSGQLAKSVSLEFCKIFSETIARFDQKLIKATADEGYKLLPQIPIKAYNLPMIDISYDKKIVEFYEHPWFLEKDQGKSWLNYFISAAMSKIFYFDKEPSLINAAQKDFAEAKKNRIIGKLNELQNVVLFHPKGLSCLDEESGCQVLNFDSTIGGLLASKQPDGGIYDKGCVFGYRDKDIMQSLFPNLNKSLDDLIGLL